MKQKIYIIDWNNFIYRVFYAIPPFSLKDGTPINAVFGMAKILKWIYEYDKPDYLYFVLDSHKKSFRDDIYGDYKATRQKTPDDLIVQKDYINILLEKMWIKSIVIDWYEADDVIWTLATNLGKEQDNSVFILSWDKDLYQFITDNVFVYDTMKRKVFKREDVPEKFWVWPEHVVDYLAICWDTSDNIPGIPWFWPKKAQELIGKFGSLENIYEHINELTWKTKETLENNREIAFISKKLATICVTVPFDYQLEEHTFRNRDILNSEALEYFKELDFKSLVPASMETQKDKIDVKFKEILNPKELNELEYKIFSSWEITIVTNLDSEKNLQWIWIVCEWNNFYIDTNKLIAKDFLKKIIESEVKIIWYDLKNDLKIIWKYLENWLELWGSWNSIQWSLF